jgi:hypothetical protein
LLSEDRELRVRYRAAGEMPAESNTDQGYFQANAVVLRVLRWQSGLATTSSPAHCSGHGAAGAALFQLRAGRLQMVGGGAVLKSGHKKGTASARKAARSN